MSAILTDAELSEEFCSVCEKVHAEQGCRSVDDVSLDMVRGERERWSISENYWVERCRFEDLTALDREEWSALAGSSYSANVFMQPWFFLPAYKQFGRDQSVECVLIYQRGKTAADASVLCGLFPIVHQRRYRGFWTESISLWTHRFCYLNTPLIRRSHGVACVSGFFDWVRANYPKVGIVEFEDVSAEGGFHHALVKVLYDRSMMSFITQEYNRAQLRVEGGVEEYMGEVLSKHHGREMKRQRRRLTEQGVSELKKLGRGDSVEAWIAAFLELESQGWKGEQGTAMAQDQAQLAFFCEVIRAGHSLGHVELMGLFDGDHAVALKCNLKCGKGAYGFKIAYDEAYRKFSPGVQLELDTIKDLFATQSVDWIDSCACVNHPMIDRLWKERRGVQKIAIAMPKTSGQLAIGAMQAVRWVRRWRNRTTKWEAMEANF